MKAWKVISLGRGQAEVTLLSVRQDVVKARKVISLGSVNVSTPREVTEV